MSALFMHQLHRAVLLLQLQRMTRFSGIDLCYLLTYLQTELQNTHEQSNTHAMSKVSDIVRDVHQVSKKQHIVLCEIFSRRVDRMQKFQRLQSQEIISEHKYVINVLIFNVPTCCHLANYRVSNWQLCMQCTKTAHYFEGL